jgi:hypothetical protein
MFVRACVRVMNNIWHSFLLSRKIHGGNRSSGPKAYHHFLFWQLINLIFKHLSHFLLVFLLFSSSADHNSPLRLRYSCIFLLVRRNNEEMRNSKKNSPIIKWQLNSLLAKIRGDTTCSSNFWSTSRSQLTNINNKGQTLRETLSYAPLGAHQYQYVYIYIYIPMYSSYFLLTTYVLCSFHSPERMNGLKTYEKLKEDA